MRRAAGPSPGLSWETMLLTIECEVSKNSQGQDSSSFTRPGAHVRLGK
jgi:hypothetical protein